MADDPKKSERAKEDEKAGPERVAALGGKARAQAMTPAERKESARIAAEARWKNHEPAKARSPRATHDGILRIGGLEIPCYVLENGKRVLFQGAMISALGMSYGGNPRGEPDRLTRFTVQERLKPFVSEDLVSRIAEPLRFRTTSGGMAYGYEAGVLADLCKSVVAADRERKLQKQQEHIAQRAFALLMAFAKLGIDALVDEATGYQYDRARDELQKILEAYIAEELRPWVQKFPHEFFRQVYRLHGWDYQPGSVKRPGYVGHFINEYVYERLPPGVLDELRKKNPPVNGHRRYRHHQFLTEQTGDPHLDRQILVVTTLMKGATDKKDFERIFENAFPEPGQQLELAMKTQLVLSPRKQFERELKRRMQEGPDQS